MVSRYDGTMLRHITEADGLIGDFSDVILKDKEGNVWFANGYGLTKYDGKGFQHFADDTFVGDRITAIFEDNKGNIWLSGNHVIGQFDQWGNSPFELSFYFYHYLGSPFDMTGLNLNTSI
jgi:hypothetical protein